APPEVTLHSPWRRRSTLGRLFANASTSHLSSSLASPVSPHPSSECRKHTTSMRANSENIGRYCIMRPMLDCNRENHATIIPSLARVVGIVAGELQPVVVKLVSSRVLDAVAWIAGAGRDFLRWVEGGFRLTGDRRL
ncbi:hypothetical protein N7499_003278, partial [Penicillium canescens]